MLSLKKLAVTPSLFLYMSRRNDPFNDFNFDRSAYHTTRAYNSEMERYYALKRQLLEEKLDQEAQKARVEEKKQREETQKLLDYYKTQVEELNKTKEIASDQSQTAAVIKGPVDIRAPQNNNHSQTFLDNARNLIKANSNGETNFTFAS